VSPLWALLRHNSNNRSSLTTSLDQLRTLGQHVKRTPNLVVTRAAIGPAKHRLQVPDLSIQTSLSNSAVYDRLSGPPPFARRTLRLMSQRSTCLDE
jgi:hypothetical protein